MNIKLSGLFNCFICLILLIPIKSTASNGYLCHNNEPKKTVIYYSNGGGASQADVKSIRKMLSDEYSSILHQLGNNYDSIATDKLYFFDYIHNDSRSIYDGFIEFLELKHVESNGLSPRDLIELSRLSKDILAESVRYMISRKTGRIATKLQVNQVIDKIKILSDYFFDYAREDVRLTEKYVKSIEDEHYETYLRLLELGSRVIIIAHDSGNIYANKSVRRIISESPSYRNSIAVIGTGSLSDKNKLASRHTHTTAFDDKTVNHIRNFYSDILHGNTNNGSTNVISVTDWFDGRDFWNHDFLKSYFADSLESRKTIKSWLEHYALNLKYPHEKNAIKITGDYYGGNSIAQLHLSEINPSIVNAPPTPIYSYSIMNASIPCDDLTTGRYKISINVRGIMTSSDRAKIVLKVGDNYHKSLDVYLTDRNNEIGSQVNYWADVAYIDTYFDYRGILNYRVTINYGDHS